MPIAAVNCVGAIASMGKVDGFVKQKRDPARKPEGRIDVEIQPALPAPKPTLLLPAPEEV